MFTYSGCCQKMKINPQKEKRKKDSTHYTLSAKNVINLVRKLFERGELKPKELIVFSPAQATDIVGTP